MTVIMVIAYVVMVMIVGVVVSGGLVRVAVFVTVSVVFQVGFLAVCWLGRVEGAGSHGDCGERSKCVSVAEPSVSYASRKAGIDCGRAIG